MHIGLQALTEQPEITEADRAELQRTEQRGTEALALPAIGDRNRKLAASLVEIEGIARFADDGIASLSPPFGDQGKPVGLAGLHQAIRGDLGEIADRAHEAVVARRLGQRSEMIGEAVDVANARGSYPDGTGPAIRRAHYLHRVHRAARNGNSRFICHTGADNPR